MILKKPSKLLEMMENTGKLDEFLRTLRSNGVQEITIGDISLKFTHFVSLPAEGVSKFIDAQGDGKLNANEEEELLYYSSGGR
mgnify:CR=1 FL=1|tara:strand:+ start:2882 stop:3130 length:249 start_codon:yes stop_codon:yes gene_type:complete